MENIKKTKILRQYGDEELEAILTAIVMEELAKGENQSTEDYE
ncbi:hypothetical protein [Geosporobacter ferrireducens]|nr:hypothetical protein [Geosporobacter ferrireducens]